MMAISHAFVGVAIATQVQSPIASAVLIITSHFLMDLIPHWDFGTDWKKRSIKATGLLAIGDTLVAIIVPLLIFYKGSPLAILPTNLSLLQIFLAVCWGNLPDWLEAPYFLFFASKDGHHKARGGQFGIILGKIHGWLETYVHTRAGFAQGVSTQIAVVLFTWMMALS